MKKTGREEYLWQDDIKITEAKWISMEEYTDMCNILGVVCTKMETLGSFKKMILV